MSAQGSKPHELRTATEPRQNSFYKLRVSHIYQVNPTIRLIRFNIFCGCTSLDWSKDNSENLTYNLQPPLEFSPGQWLDVHIPNIEHAGGFTITSTPQDASTQENIDIAADGNDKHLPYVELAIQYSPSNPAAKWFWQPIEQILGSYVKVRIGGGFVWPPPNGMALDEIKNIVFVAGGVGINPLISMISYIHRTRSCLLPSARLHLLYSTRIPSSSTPINMAGPSEAVNALATDRLSKILFLDRLQQISRDWNRAKDNTNSLDLQLFLTNSYLENRGGNKVNFQSSILDTDNHITVHSRRIEAGDLHKAVGGSDELRSGTICYVCGPPVMTDELVKELETFIGSEDDKTRKRVLYEKWW
ncbi:hypothetical protein H113_01126 [Trichophyton rubrum MR1459]|uniref:FAD-binding FR-type domain-containing protein n=3 Tax=Trichophyton TaxID=5550 RepID=F2SY83_TRIRC|nr:uncharacterized protein TERG_07542 [Trichophyton rubrum CBS 118892]EGD91320.2 hypothetical protein TERG_07542 [Trichophyton rubrum CBS 118892]EZF99246.1 hypothetical protein H113_01126 [Trichophyton rubrum MR1459]EZG10210.1 hypothetical protein H106_00923 [Trichophyton rubrum CBS 735.88]